MGKLVQLPTNTPNLPEELRAIADQLESGELGQYTSGVVVLESTDSGVATRPFGVDKGVIYFMGLLHAAVISLDKDAFGDLYSVE